MVTETQSKVITLLPGQAALLTDFINTVLAAIAGTGGGKTALGYWWLHSRMEAYPGFTWGMAEPTFNMLAKIILSSSDPERPSLIEYLATIGHHPEWENKRDLILKTDFGKIYLGSADNPDSMQGAAVKGYWLDEPGLMTLLAYQTARQRVSMMNGQILLTTTPYNLGWLKTEVADRNGTERIHVQKWRSIDRPGYPRERYEAEKRILPPWRFAMLYDAEFERPAGTIYSAFDERTCLIDRFPIPANWLIHSGHDFGTANPAALFTAQDPGSGNFFHFAEYLPGAGRSTNEHVQTFHKVIGYKPDGKPAYNVIKRVGGNQTTEEEIRGNYAAHGWPITAPKLGRVEAQIDKVIGLHQLNKIFVFRDLVHYLDEKRSFCRELDDRGLPTEKISNESRFHLMACERTLMSDFMPETVAYSEAMPVWRYR